jgi:hypothetical protein
MSAPRPVVDPALVETHRLPGAATDGPLSAGELIAYIAADINDDAPRRFERLAPRMSDTQYWQLLAYLWVYTDAPHAYVHVWRRLFRSERPGRDHAMHPDERAELAEFGDRIDVFRGFCKHGGENGIAWTPDRDLAVAFAERWVGYVVAPDGLFVARATIPADRIVALFDRKSVVGREVVVPSLRGFPRRIEALDDGSLASR